jgi:putative hydrolase of the HAD superfamily
VIRVVLFDLDETLYPRAAGVMQQIGRLIQRFIETRLGLSPDEAAALRRRYFLTYGTTMRGLQTNESIDPDEYLRYVHDIPLEDYLVPNPALDAALASIPQDKVVFTNASREHAERVLALLGIEQRFSRIVDVRDVAYQSKPQQAAYRRICALLDVEPQECVLVEDNARNLKPARKMGMTAILVGDGTHDQDIADYTIERIEDIGAVMASINGQPRKQ